MQFGQVEGFVAVAQSGSLTQASEVLFVTQPALTARLHALEAELGQLLFTRTRRGMLLTEAGRAFLPYAERALASLAHGGEAVAGVARGSQGELTIGAAPAVSAYVLPWVLSRYTAVRPSVRLVVRTGHSDEVLSMIDRGEAQIGLVRALRDSRVQHVPLFDDLLVLVVDPGHPLARRKRILIRELGQTRLILFDRASSFFELTSNLFHSAGVAPAGIMELDSIDAAKQMVKRRLGVALMPGTAVAEELASGSLRRLTLADEPLLQRRIEAILARHSQPDSAVMGPLMQLLQQIPEYVPGSQPIDRG